jgi:integrase
MIKMYNLLLYEGTRKLPEIFSKEDINKILDITKNSKKLYPKHDWGLWLRARDRCIILIIYFFALRPKEALSLMFDDFNISLMTLKIRGYNNKIKKDRIKFPYLPHF